MENMGYAVSAIASSGEKAIEKVATTFPDLVLMDIMLNEDVDGEQTSEKIRKFFDVPLVFLIANFDLKTLPRAKTKEPFDYIKKPFGKKELQFATEKALYRHRMETKLKKSCQWFSSTLNCIGEAVITTDKKGFVKFMNPAAEALMGIKHKDAAGKSLKDTFNIICKDLNKKVEKFLAKVNQEGIVIGIVDHAMLTTYDGRETAVDIIGGPIKDEKQNIIGLVLIFIDITERMASWESLQKAYQQNKSTRLFKSDISPGFLQNQCATDIRL